VTASELVGGELRSRNPATLEDVGGVAATPPEQVAAVVAGAAAAQEGWARSGFGERRELLRSVARLLLARVDEIARTVEAETAKPPTEALVHDLYPALDQARWLAANAERVLRPERLSFPQLHLKHKRGRLLYEPLGVAAVISPWNLPFAIPFAQVATAVAAGNAAVLKPSELTPLAGAWVERAFAEAGAPEGLVRTVQGAGEVGDALVRAEGVAKVFFTGSAEVGRQVAAAAAERLRPVVLELGGKDPLLVFADADLGRAVDGALFGSFLNCGQACVSVERIYVERAVQHAFTERLAARARELAVGREVGPLVSERERARVEELVEDAVERGAEVLAGARRPEARLPGSFYAPTVLGDVPPDARLRREEIFGPVVAVEAFDGEDDAVRRANGTAFGLGASVWTRDLERGRRVARRLQAGMVWVNDYGYSFGAAQASWGGVKGSGFGRTKSRHGLYECVQVKYVDEDPGRLRPPWWFPYDEPTERALRAALGVLYGEGVGERAREAWRGRRELAHLARRYLSRP
jgi:acyl-CoA reductase-like NAD-dependent aldehyde dehydrogenase